MFCISVGAPIGMPKDFASLDLAIIHPSLLDNTITGLFFNKGLKLFRRKHKIVTIN